MKDATDTNKLEAIMPFPKLEVRDRRIFLDGAELRTATDYEIKCSAGQGKVLLVRMLVKT